MAGFVTIDDPDAGGSPAGSWARVLSERGLLGEVDGGPIFNVVLAVPPTSRFTVTGCGLAANFDAPRARALITALQSGLNMIGEDA
jgi:hypothetical protein